MTTVLVTGGTGTLGRDTVPAVRARGAGTVVMSRRPADAKVRRADLATGAGLDRAVDGVEVVVHLAAGRDQAGETRRLVEAAHRAGVGHLVLMSIVGIDRIPLSYYRAKLAAEQVVERGPVPWSILRSTQFHPFVAGIFAAQRRSPLLLAPRFSVQPVDTRVVAERLADLALAEPQGRAADLGGPEVLELPRAAELYWESRGWRRPVAGLALPGRTFAGYAAGHHLSPGRRGGGRTFGEFLEAERKADHS